MVKIISRSMAAVSGKNVNKGLKNEKAAFGIDISRAGFFFNGL